MNSTSRWADPASERGWLGILCLAGTLMLSAPLNALGAPWDIRQYGNSDSNGGWKHVTVGLTADADCPKSLEIYIWIPKDKNQNEKARVVCNKINASRYYSKFLKATYIAGTNTCRIEAKNPPCANITSVVVREKALWRGWVLNQPGDKGTGIIDDPEPNQPLFVGLCDLVGETGTAELGMATLSVALNDGEDMCEVVTDTYGKSAGVIEAELAAYFNADPKCTADGRTAELIPAPDGTAILVNSLECPKGIACGSDDPAFGFVVPLLEEETATADQACCFSINDEDDCEVLSAIDCILADGVPAGVATCDADLCKGVCCSGDTCGEVSAFDCGGEAFRGLGTPCIEDGCEPDIPAVSEWGLVVMVLLVLAAGTVVIRRARAARAPA